MTIQNINIGNIANDGTGDDLREAFRKVNENFDELDLRSIESNYRGRYWNRCSFLQVKLASTITI